MKKNYKEPNILVLDMDGEDIIATSEVTSGAASTGTATIIVNDVSSSFHKGTSEAKGLGEDDFEETDEW